MTHAIDVCTNMKGDVIKDALICDEICFAPAGT